MGLTFHLNRLRQWQRSEGYILQCSVWYYEQCSGSELGGHWTQQHPAQTACVLLDETVCQFNFGPVISIGLLLTSLSRGNQLVKFSRCVFEDLAGRQFVGLKCVRCNCPQITVFST